MEYLFFADYGLGVVDVGQEIFDEYVSRGFDWIEGVDHTKTVFPYVDIK